MSAIEQIRARNDLRRGMEADMAEQFPGGTSWQMMEMANDIAALLDVAVAAEHTWADPDSELGKALARLDARTEAQP
jgi:hypothetical protein